MTKPNKALVRQPAPSMVKGISSANLGTPDFSLALTQHDAYCRALRQIGIEVLELPADPEFPDCCFIEDTVVVVEHIAVITNPGHPARNGEQSATESYLRENSCFKVCKIHAPGTLDGGDVLRLGDHFFIGLTARTNEQGAQQLADFIKQAGLTSSIIRVNDLLHLKTGITAVDDESVVCVSHWMENSDFARIKRKLAVPPQEHVAANCLRIGDTVVVPSGCPEISRSLSDLGKQVINLNMSEFQKLDGGLTCLSVLIHDPR